MDWFTNMYSPITERTDITGVLTAYNLFNHNSALQSLQGFGSVYNFSKGKNISNGQANYNYYSIDPFGMSVVGNFSNYMGQSNNFSVFSAGCPVYNFTGNGRTNGTSTVTKTAISRRSPSKVKSSTPKKTPPDLGQKIAYNASKYLGYNEDDGSFKLFSNDKEWCADFVTYVVKESYKEQGLSSPKGFGSWRCENLKQWAINNNKFLYTAGKSNKQDIIKSRVKAGDIVIMRENGASHTGIVISVDRKTGEYTTVEGNVKTLKGVDMVIEVKHRPNEPDVSGFIQLV